MKIKTTETKTPSNKKLAVKRAALRKLSEETLQTAAGATGCGWPGYCSTYRTCNGACCY
jgi:hypothetical protein